MEFWVRWKNTDMKAHTTPLRRSCRSFFTKPHGFAWMPRILPLTKTSAFLPLKSSSPARMPRSSTPRSNAMRAMGSESFSVVMCVMSARFFVRPQFSPSGVSLGQIMPHCEPWRARRAGFLRVFSNCGFTRVIMPSAAMYDSLQRAMVTPWRLMLKRWMTQLPVAMGRLRPVVMTLEAGMGRLNFCAFVGFSCVCSSVFMRAMNCLNEFSNSHSIICPASSRRLLP
mmetsp:Transcript_775/g.2805  ORF Transcript_775/g.2805 Transcript_775/m.2805 type:complete len:226 (+) Transcript_775:1654-2331(+)